ncbi:MAG: glutamine--fructose-6-phosphate transaminase (isomerizing) [Candidatus Gracilibacteria bacterium]|nr:glutamine--fructose-6-phosphate transaminase (isomerizing) [Candidatus Gracilibacteria bacterium]
MCGIFAYNGEKDSIPFLIEGLKNLEYRGYDSAGIVGLSEKGNIYLEKAVGKVSNLATKVELAKRNEIYNVGIAHTRWATHGGVTEENAHPHYSENKRFYIVHNGIIENYKELRKKLEKKYKFYSDTDSEVVAKLLEEFYDGKLLTTIQKVSKIIIGAYALAIIDKNEPNTLVGTKLGSPMIIGIQEKDIFLASDINALSGVASEFVQMEDNEIVIIKEGKYTIFSSNYTTSDNLSKISRNSEKIEKNFKKAEKGKFETFTEKEIFEIPEVIENVFKGRINFDTRTIHNETLQELNEHDIERIEIIASGSSYFAGYVGTYWFREIAGIPAEARISNEFLYDRFLPDPKTLYIFMSQSGETADVRECLKMVKSKGCLTFGIVNVVGSTIARMCDMGLFSHAGTEIGVASTKNIIGQLGVLILLAVSIGNKKDLQYTKGREIIGELAKLKKIFEKQLEKSKEIKHLAKKYSNTKSLFYLGRNLLYGAAMEGSLKLKELSYIHSESYSSGEMKHGPLALVNKDFLCIFLNLKGVFQEKTNSNIKEVKARNGKVLGIITKGESDKELYDDTIEVPEVDKIISPFVCLIPMWLFALHTAVELGRDVDKPQNLAKSVTVE